MVSFVSCSSRSAGVLCCRYVCKHGSVVLNEAIFHVMI